MNFLAHIYLSFGDEDLLIGNFMADFLTNRQVSKLKPSVKRGVELHRLIDSFTDSHPMVRQGTKRLRKMQGKYAPVVIDILYDHILANLWEQFCAETLEIYVQKIYHVLTLRNREFPDKLKKRVDLMVEDNFLIRYRDLEGLRRSLMYMDRRTKFPSQCEQAVYQLQEEWEFFSSEFQVFFPEVIEICQQFIKNDKIERT